METLDITVKLNTPKGAMGYCLETENKRTFEIEIDTAVSDFVKFSKDFGINYKQLKLHNPWLREEFLNNKSRKKYKIELPNPKYYSQK